MPDLWPDFHGISHGHVMGWKCHGSFHGLNDFNDGFHGLYLWLTLTVYGFND